MSRLSPCRSLASAIVLAAAASAQVAYDTNIGAPLGMGDDTIAANLALGFNCTMPGGGTVTAIDVDSNGRILPPGGDLSDFTESIAEMITEAHATIAPFWDDLNPGALQSDDVYFNAYHNGTENVAVVTWKDVVRFGATAPAFSIQVKLYANRFTFLYDARMGTAHDPIVGVSQGNNAADPGSRDISAAAPLLGTTGVTTAYEDMATFDLAPGSLEWLLDGTGGWNVLIDFPTPGTAAVLGRACVTGIDYIPNGAGGYVITEAGASAFDPTFGPIIGSAGDDVIFANNALGFTFTWPGGTTSADIGIESNPRILPSGLGFADYSPTIAELLANAHPTIAPLYTDLNLQINLGTGNVHFKTQPGFAYVTWDRVAQYGGTGTPITVQCVLRADSSFAFSYVTTSSFENGVGLNGDTLVGCSSGNGAIDPGETDYRVALPLNSATATSYEFWDGPGETLDLQLTTRALNRPIAGGTWNLVIDGIPAPSAGAFMMIGFFDLNAGPLDVIGIPTGFLHSSNNIPAVSVPFAGQSGAFALSIGSTPGTVGLPLVLQAATISPGATPLGVVLGNAIAGTIGEV